MLLQCRNDRSRLGVAADFGDVSGGVGVMVDAAGEVVVVAADAVLNILGGKLLVAAVGAAGRIPTVYVHLQQDGEIEANLE